MATSEQEMINVNVGVLGHVDSGKTHLVRVLSTHLSTAALDKHPQSQQRGMTLDLGFSAFQLPMPTAIPNGPEFQITLVDCPGHASLFKTILGGVHIIDWVLLVVDVQKGLQPQTIECLVVAALAVRGQIVIALNKVDLLPESERETRISDLQREIRSFLRKHFVEFQVDKLSMIPVAAAPAISTDYENSEPAAIGIEALVSTLQHRITQPTRDASGPLCFAIDHCFAIQGNGTILTGTVLAGSVQVNDLIELPSLQVTKKVKSMQMFKRIVTRASQGDRVALRVNGLDASLVERSVAISPQSLPFVNQVIISVNQIPFFKGSCKSGAKFHATIGHTTVVAVVTFFERGSREQPAKFAPEEIYQAVSEVPSLLVGDDAEPSARKFNGFSLLQFEQAVICPPRSVIVCSRFDLDPKRFHCRLAFHGDVQAFVWCEELPKMATDPPSMALSALRIGKIKERRGVVDKILRSDGSTAEFLGRDLIPKDVDWAVYGDTVVWLESARSIGKVVGPFGKSGKCRIELMVSPKEATLAAKPQSLAVGDVIVLRFIKLNVLKPPKNSKSSKTVSTKTTTSRKLLQDVRVVYPELFTKTAEESTSPEDVQTPDTVEEAREDAPVEASSHGSPRCTGQVERLKGETTSDGRNPFVIVTGLFASDTEANGFVGHKVQCRITQQGKQIVETGVIEKPFGKAGKVRVVFTEHGGTLAQLQDIVELC